MRLTYLPALCIEDDQPIASSALAAYVSDVVWAEAVAWEPEVGLLMYRVLDQRVPFLFIVRMRSN